MKTTSFRSRWVGLGLLMVPLFLMAQTTEEVPVEWRAKLHSNYSGYVSVFVGRAGSKSNPQYSKYFDKSEPWKEAVYQLRTDEADVSLGATSGMIRGIFIRPPSTPNNSFPSATLRMTTNGVMALATNYCKVLGLNLDSQLRPREVIVPKRGGIWSFNADRFVGHLRHNSESIYFSISDADGKLQGMGSRLTTKNYEGAKVPKASVVDARVQAKDYMQKLLDRDWPSDKFERVTPGVAGTPELVIDIPQKYQDRLKTDQRIYDFRKQPLEPRLVYIVGVTNNNAWHKGQSVYTGLPGSWVCVDAETGIVIGN